MGMGQATISTIENGMFQEFRISKYAKLCAIIGLNIEVAPFPALPTLSETIAETRIRQASAVEAAGMVGSVAHLAYHVGAIRQIGKAARGPKEGTFK